MVQVALRFEDMGEWNQTIPYKEPAVKSNSSKAPFLHLSNSSINLNYYSKNPKIIPEDVSALQTNFPV